MLKVATAQPGLDDEETDTAEEQSHSDGRGFVAQFQSLFVQDKSADTSDHKSESDFSSVLEGFAIRKVEEELAQSLRKERKHGKHCSGLNYNIEQLALMSAQPTFDKQQMTG